MMVGWCGVGGRVGLTVWTDVEADCDELDDDELRPSDGGGEG